MAPLDHLLERLRRLRPPPGAPAAGIAVPSAGEELSSEVAFLFASLDEAERRGEEIVREARTAAAEIEAAARERGRLLLEDAHARAAIAAAELQDRRAADCERRAQALLADAQRQSELVLARGRERIPAFSRKVAAQVLEQLQ